MFLITMLARQNGVEGCRSQWYAGMCMRMSSSTVACGYVCACGTAGSSGVWEIAVDQLRYAAECAILGLMLLGHQGDRFGCTASARLCVGTDIVELGL